VTEQHAVFHARDLHTVALEQSAGEMAPEQALAVATEMIRDRRVLTLEGGRMTTLAMRAQEQAIERRAELLAQPAGGDIGERTRAAATREVTERIGAPLSAEQSAAVEVLTGSERLAVLVGPARTGKGVVIDAAARAEQHAGHRTIGIAVSGSTAERLDTDSQPSPEHTHPRRIRRPRKHGDRRDRPGTQRSSWTRPGWSITLGSMP
jgi:ATP-dependent exoDNAse (exonuclease V) alpha subunit